MADDELPPPDRYGKRFQNLARRSREVLGIAAVVGALTGVAVYGFEQGVDLSLDALLDAPLWFIAVAPLLGLIVTHLLLTWARTDPSTADQYLRTYHEPHALIPGRPFPLKLLASFATLASGGAMGLEGPAIYLGAGIGSVATAKLRKLLTGSHAKVFIVAGAAAGVAAIFKAPATGAIFAIEVPYRDDVGRRLLLPALVGSATGYVAFAAFDGTARLFPVSGSPAFDLRDLGGALIVGALAGLVARGFSRSILWAKDLAARHHAWVRIAIAGSVLAGLAVLTDALTGSPLSIGPGYTSIAWANSPSLGIDLVLVILVCRCLATTATVGGGGASGLFIPLVVAGDLLGRAVGGTFSALDTPLFAVMGIAAVLGAGYRVPLAAVVFVAETTGRPGFIVPGILATVVAELLMGRWSVTRYQQGTAIGQSREPLDGS